MEFGREEIFKNVPTFRYLLQEGTKLLRRERREDKAGRALSRQMQHVARFRRRERFEKVLVFLSTCLFSHDALYFPFIVSVHDLPRMNSVKI